MKVNILGAEYTITEKDKETDEVLRINQYDGYCDKTTKEIVISKKDKNCDLGDFEAYRKILLRHEIIHAFLYESGLHENFEHSQYGHDETTIDWVAVQFPKMLEVFKKAGCL